MRKIKNILSLILLGIIFASCSMLETKESSSVSFKLDSETVQKIKDAAGEAGYSSNARAADNNSLFVEVAVHGDYESSTTVQLQNEATISIEDIPIGSEIYLEAIAYTNTNGRRQNLYSGKSKTFVVNNSENLVMFVMHRVSSDSESSSSGTSGNGGNSGNGSGGNSNNQSYIGTKLPSEAKIVGDIVFNDGSAMAYSDYSSLDANTKAEKKTKAIALIFYKGTELNNNDDTTTSRTLGVGLIHDKTGIDWSTDAAGEGSSKKIETIICTPDENDSTVYTGVKNGSQNFELIGEYLNSQNYTDTTTGSDAENCYPAFFFAKNYKSELISGENTSRIITGSDYENGWYLPTIAELYQIYKNGIGSNKSFDLNTASTALGGGNFSEQTNDGDGYVSSSQHDTFYRNVWRFIFTDGTIDYDDKTYRDDKYACVIREFN